MTRTHSWPGLCKGDEKYSECDDSHLYEEWKEMFKKLARPPLSYHIVASKASVSSGTWYIYTTTCYRVGNTMCFR